MYLGFQNRVLETSWTHFRLQNRVLKGSLESVWGPKLGLESILAPKIDFIFLLNDFEPNLCFLEKAKIVILRGRGVQNQHLQFNCI